MHKTRLFVFGVVALLLLAACNNSTTPVTSEKEVSRVTTQGETSYVSGISREGCPKNSLVLVSWNGENFGRSKSAEVLQFMADVLREADIVALQEVSTLGAGAQAVAKLADELNRTGSAWGYLLSPSTHDSPSKERFAFLWKAGRVKAVPEHVLLVDSLKGVMVREPAKIHLRVDGTRDLTLFSFHLAPTEKNPKAEVASLAQSAPEFSGDTSVLVGDFNLGHNDLDQVLEKVFKFQHQITGKTSLKQRAEVGKSYLSKEYDNIYTRGGIRVCRSAIVDFVPRFPDVASAHTVSDHLPVFIIFNFSEK